MNMSRLFWVGVLTAVAAVGNAAADRIVDTGTPANGPGYGLWDRQYFAGEFSIGQAETITGIQGYLAAFSGGAVEVALHNSAGNIPGSIIYLGSLSLAAGAGADWYGLANLSVSLAPGAYWVSFRPDASFNGIMPGTAPNPLADYASAAGHTPYDWKDYGPGVFAYLAQGLRIDAIATVPEPGSGALGALGLALVGGVLAMRRRSRQAG